jgi:hypothetical protein
MGAGIHGLTGKRRGVVALAANRRGLGLQRLAARARANRRAPVVVAIVRQGLPPRARGVSQSRGTRHERGRDEALLQGGYFDGVVEPLLPEPLEPVLPEPLEPVLPEPLEPVLPEPLEPVLPVPLEPVLPVEPEPMEPEPDAEPLVLPGVELLAEGDEDDVSLELEAELEGEVELDVELGEVDDEELLGVLLVLLPDPVLPVLELPERSQPVSAVVARAMAATTGMSLFMNFSIRTVDEKRRPRRGTIERCFARRVPAPSRV